MTIVEGGGESPRAEEGGSEGVPIMNRRVVGKMVVRLGTWSSERGEPLS